MNLVESCLKGDESETIKALGEMLSRAQPSAIWAILMHAASWHEQKTYDTPHSTILTFAIHRMIEDVGFNDKMLEKELDTSPINTPEDLKKSIQLALVQRLAQHLASVDHWLPEKGPMYDARSGVDSPGNLLRKFTQSIREKSVLGAMEGCIGLSSMDQTIGLTRMVLSMSAEEPDSLGHGFIMPLSLLTELPISKYRHPHIAALWHLAEYMVRKVPGKRPEKYIEDEQFKQLAKPTNLTGESDLIGSSLVHYGILGHNGIFAHRIAYAAHKGLVHDKTVDWLLRALKKNMGVKVLTKTQLDVKKVMTAKPGTDWECLPSRIDLPHSESTREWFAQNLSDIWDAMTDLQSESFESLIPKLKRKDWGMVRAAQYAFSALYGQPKSSHIIIFTQAAWNLVDMGLVSEALVALQIHRMVREYLKGK
ncbi:MAG: hypothetical protein ACFFDR_11395 [Candidatus Thorarchaeota archaeon]